MSPSGMSSLARTLGILCSPDVRRVNLPLGHRLPPISTSAYTTFKPVIENPHICACLAAASIYSCEAEPSLSSEFPSKLASLEWQQHP